MDLKNTLKLVQVTLDGPTPDAVTERAFRSLQVAATANLEHALVLCVDERTTDAAALRALVERERPHLLVPEIEALATAELVRIEEDGLATVIPTARAAHITMNRERIRVLAAEVISS